ncbi:hypothetical protein N9Z27_02410 [Alphaproteobacteria bacterium]|nr:hypothetical protein [Alphaproteobacteria bacterium]
MTTDSEHQRLSDRILSALELAIEQKDLNIAENLRHALELAMTRKAGGGEFVEKRDYPEKIEQAMNELRALSGK